MAVPEGESTLASWWSSITSAVSNHGAASSAKRIIKMAPMAKLGAMRQLLRVKVARKRSRSSSVNPVVPTTACTPRSAHQARLWRAASRWVKSTITSGCSSRCSGLPATSSSLSTAATVRSFSPAAPGSTAAASSRSGSSATARQTVAPIRPAAPNTPTCTVMVAVLPTRGAVPPP